MNYFISTQGTDPTPNNPVPGSFVEPWKTLQYALSLESPVEPGDTLRLRGGRHFQSRINVHKAGASARPITIRNHGNEEVVIDGSIQELSDPAAWELIDPTRGVYRSRNRFPVPCPVSFGPASRAVRGLFQINSNTFALISYKQKSHLFSDTEFWDESNGYYAGPGVFYEFDDNSPDFEHIFLRIQAPDPNAVGGPQNTFDSTGRQYSPSEVSLSITHATGPLCMGLAFRNGASHLHWRGFILFNQGMRIARNFELPVEDVRFRNIKVFTAGDGFLFSGQANNFTRNIHFDRVSFTTFRPPWVAWMDAKGGSAVASSVVVRAINLVAGIRDVEVKHCRFFDTFDGMIVQGEPNLNVHDVRVHHTRMVNILDDAITVGSDGYNLEIGHNRCLQIGSGVSYQVTGQPTDESDIGKVYVHHNLLVGVPHLKQRAESNAVPAVFWTLSPLSTTHGNTKNFGICPRKIYQNTVIIRKEFNGHEADEHTRFTLSLYQGKNEPLFPQATVPEHSHEVYNNVFMVEADSRIGERQKVHTGREIFDGNIYWRTANTPQSPLLMFWRELVPQNPGDFRDFDTLDDFRADADFFPPTQAYYSPGWESAGDQVDPELDGDFRPIAGGPAATGNIDLRGKSWPGYDGKKYRGAFPPRGLPGGCLFLPAALFKRWFC